jgi:hypothetical protein
MNTTSILYNCIPILQNNHFNTAQYHINTTQLNSMLLNSTFLSIQPNATQYYTNTTTGYINATYTLSMLYEYYQYYIIASQYYKTTISMLLNTALHILHLMIHNSTICLILLMLPKFNATKSPRPDNRLKILQMAKTSHEDLNAT